MIEKQQVKQAVDALLALMKTKDDTVLFDQAQKIDIQFTMKQIPKVKHKTIPIELPHTIHDETREVCLFVKDLNKKNREYEPTVQHYETLFKEKKVKNISKIVPLKALRTDYSMHASKRSLAKAYDLFLADDCVLGLLPGLLGKIFYAKKKTVPVSVNLGVKDLKKEIDEAVNNTRCVLQGTGSTSMVCVGNSKMTKNQLLSNVLAACQQLVAKIPGGKANIKNIHVKSVDTPAIPLYMSLESPNNVELPKVENKKIDTFVDEITTLEEGKVVIRADGMVRVVGGKKTTKEEDVSDDDNDDDDDLSDDDDVDDTPRQMKVPVGNKPAAPAAAAEDGSDDDEDDDESDDETKIVKGNNKGPKQAKNGIKRKNEDKENKTVAKKKQKQKDTKQKQASAKKAATELNDKPVADIKPKAGGKKQRKRAKNA